MISWPYYAVVALLAFFIARISRRIQRPALKSVPGPFFGRLSSLYRLYLSFSGRSYQHFIKLRQQYGPIVRIGPKHVIISDPTLLKVVYSADSKYLKSDFYGVFALSLGDHCRDTVFSTRDAEYHHMLQQHVNGLLCNENLAQFEQIIEKCTKMFVEKMLQFHQQRINLSHWLDYWAFDTTSGFCLGETFGFMSTGSDVGGTIRHLWTGLRFGLLLGLFPHVNQYVLESDKIFHYLRFAGVRHPSSPFIALLTERVAKADADPNTQTLSIRSWLRDEKKRSGQEYDIETMIVHLSNYLYVFARPDTAKLIKHSVAGSASTSTTISSVLYHSMKHPGVYKRLVAEVRVGSKTGSGQCPVQFSETLRMPYLQAVVKEAMRLEPANSFPLERVVPNDGLIVNGHHLPAGTYVGMTPYIIGRDTSIYGKDSAQFRPERWLDADATTMQRMERHFFAFSRGKRGCPGRQLALMLMTKFVVEVLRAFDIEWAGDNDSWDFRVWWITQKNGFLVKFIPLKEGQN